MKKSLFISMCLMLFSCVANAKWVDVPKKACINNGGYMKNGVCSAARDNIAKICQSVNAIVPTGVELRDEIINCGGVFVENEDNIKNVAYQTCRKEKGFISDSDYSTSVQSEVINFNGGTYYIDMSYSSPHNIRCLVP